MLTPTLVYIIMLSKNDHFTLIYFSYIVSFNSAVTLMMFRVWAYPLKTGPWKQGYKLS